MLDETQVPQDARSFLKWAGGKRLLIPILRELIPPGERLIEPFAGSGVVTLNLNYQKYIMGEANSDLITVYSYLQTEGDKFIKYCRQYFVKENNCKEAYLQLRDRFNTTTNLREKSALFIYLNRHGYNGLCRYNSSGIYNVPFGQMPYPKLQEASMHLFKERLKATTLLCQDFSKTMQDAQKGDVVYCDPPYVPLTATANFNKYSSGTFGETQQLELAHLAETLAKRGIPVVISNHDTEFTREIYRNAQLTSFPVSRTISCNSASRTPVSEVVAVFT